MVTAKMKRALFLTAMFLVVFSSPALTAQTAPEEATGGVPSEVQEPVEEHDLKPEIGKIDQAGNKIGEKIEVFGAKASDRLGGWIDSKVAADISWLKLLFCLLLVFLVVIVERVVRMMIQRRIDTIPSVEGQISWVRLILKAVLRPLSLLLWVYGIYGALSPLYSHFQGPEGSNLVHLVLQKTATVGGILAFFWFVYQFVQCAWMPACPYGPTARTAPSTTSWCPCSARP
jgi:hypothetical protein